MKQKSDSYLRTGFIHLLPLIAIFFIGLIVYFGYKSIKPKVTSLPITPATLPPNPSINTNVPVGWIKYVDPKGKFEIYHPKEVDIAQVPPSIEIKTFEEIEKMYKDIGNCPGRCGYFADDPSRVKSEFEIIKEISGSSSCIVDKSFQNRVKNNFSLFAMGIERSWEETVKGVKNANNNCGFRYLATDGYDVNVANYFYKAAFIQDSKLASINLGIFLTSLPEVKKLTSSFSYNEDGSCSEECSQKEYEFIDKSNSNLPVFVEASNIFDKMVSTFKMY